MVGQGHRPLLDDDPLATLTRMAQDRTSLYADVADLTIDVDDLTPEQVAEVILIAIEGSS